MLGREGRGWGWKVQQAEIIGSFVLLILFAKQCFNISQTDSLRLVLRMYLYILLLFSSLFHRLRARIACVRIGYHRYCDDISTVTSSVPSSGRPMRASLHEYEYADSNESITPPNALYDAANIDRASLEHWLRITYHKEKAVLDAKRKHAQSQFTKATEIVRTLCLCIHIG